MSYFALKRTWASVTAVTATTNCSDGGNDITTDRSVAHKGISLKIPDDTTMYCLAFDVIGGPQETKWRGPYDNTEDICWHLHGNLFSWELNPC
ncbi:34951_t:CDS:2 [Gigaspora margarita]|uniref:34951_t:CDS:1 n=1 Tax=Gigaspora margarita TaxID=4874 RepID=A0ABN7UZB9_GIGMA|nr:34951_t:CDS:2 [Gigaspora margarita]